jgi:hypothetical protein
VKQRYIRPGDELSDDTVIVIRGGTLADVDVVDDALAAFEVYGVYAISVFALVDTTVDELAQEPPLVRFEWLTLMNAGAVRRAGLRLLPTGRRTLHHSIEFDDLQDGVARLQSCEHRTVMNPYHVR